MVAKPIKHDSPYLLFRRSKFNCELNLNSIVDVLAMYLVDRSLLLVRARTVFDLFFIETSTVRTSHVRFMIACVFL